MRLRLLPRNTVFSQLFLRHIRVTCEAARLLVEEARSGRELSAVSRQIQDLEGQGDAITHEIFQTLHQTTVLPFDPEDIHALASRLDDVLDGVEEAAHRISLYELNTLPQPAIRLAETVLACAHQLEAACAALERDEAVQAQKIEISRLENEADQVARQAVGALFRTERDPIMVMKLKDVYDILEATVDSCEDAADVLGTIVLKSR